MTSSTCRIVGKCIQYGVRSASVPRTASKPNVAVSSGQNVQRGGASKEQRAFLKTERVQRISWQDEEYWRSASFFVFSQVVIFSELKNGFLLYTVCLLHRQNIQSPQDAHLFLTACRVVAFFFFSLFSKYNNLLSGLSIL